MDRLGSIVVGVDFSPASAAALTEAIRLAAWNRAKILAIHVVDTLVVVEMEEALSPMMKNIQESLISDANAQWEKFRAAIPGSEQIEFVVSINNRLVEVLKRCKERSADLLMLGAYGEQQESGVGPLASQCVQKAPCKVMLIHPPHHGPFRHVAACVDFSPTSRQAVEVAMRIVAQDGGKLSVLHIFKPPWKRYHYRAPTEATSPDFQHAFRQTLRTRLEQFCGEGKPEAAWGKPEYHLIEDSSHGAAIIRFTKQNAADLVVLGTRGRTNLRDVLLGSTAERVIHDAPCSVLAVKPVE